MTSREAVAEDTQQTSWLDDLRDMSDAELGEFALDTDTKLRMYRELAGYAAGELLRRRPEGGKLKDFGDVLVTYVDQYSPYEYDIDALARVFRKMVSKSEWDSMIEDEVIPEQVVTRVNTKSADAIARKRGTMAVAALESCRRRLSKEPRLTFQRIPEVTNE